MHHGSAEAWLSQVVKGGLSVVINGLRLRRNIVVLSLAIFCVGLGEELWARFLPKCLESLGASVRAIGAFATLQDPLAGQGLAEIFVVLHVTNALGLTAATFGVY